MIYQANNTLNENVLELVLSEGLSGLPDILACCSARRTPALENKW